MTLDLLSGQYRCRVTRDGCGDPIVTGKCGHLYTDRGRLMLCLSDDGRKPFTSATRKLSLMRQLAGRLTVTQQGDYEVIGQVAEDAATIRLCLRLLGIRTRRVPTPKQAEVLAAGRQLLHVSLGSPGQTPYDGTQNASPDPSPTRSTPRNETGAFSPICGAGERDEKQGDAKNSCSNRAR